MGKRQRYPEEFKAEAVRLAQTSGQSIRQTALNLGISPSHQWYNDAVAWGEQWLVSNGHLR